MRKDLRPVDSLPSECIERDPVRIVPADLCRHKIPDPAFFHDLRQGSREAVHHSRYDGRQVLADRFHDRKDVLRDCSDRIE